MRAPGRRDHSGTHTRDTKHTRLRRRSRPHKPRQATAKRRRSCATQPAVTCIYRRHINDTIGSPGYTVHTLPVLRDIASAAVRHGRSLATWTAAPLGSSRPSCESVGFMFSQDTSCMCDDPLD
ncbi:Piso0_004574 [Millerozyma farinosa CBS 7064]|uniref:Piso0_004574 protein n=1 Tax=Pichia sorbitophila (strain ATCC MYA-4447 / BCRC 22081 / CBS 7064 / NBRC 10061 / NRRL Y-12695) TaxID=559304 RepID=G8Y5U7_PICSO|nr:Piso0_004574 [Millerozyma farinosa CBS 7064]CCE85008.1 Piso0_004574 [Millerozyma farinosa CBS 7064]